MSAILENAVGGLLAAEAHGMLALLLSRIGEEIKLGWGFRKELEELQSQFTTLSVMLDGTCTSSQSNNNNNKLIDDWLKKVNDAAYDADDLLDECAYEAVKRRCRTRKRRDKFRDEVSFPLFRYHMARRVRDLRKLIASIYGDAKDLGLKPIKLAAGGNNSHDWIEDRTQQNRRQWVDDQYLIGRDEDVTQLVKLLCDSSNITRDLTVIGVVGLAGLGKTALSKRVCKAQEVMECFNSQVIWLVVSHNFNQTDILKRMVELLYKEASNLSESQVIVEKLREKLNGKRYLLVLDDVWDTIDWEPFRCALQEIGGSKGSSLLVTSRGRNVVAKMDTYGCDNNGERTMQRASVYQLQGLNEEDSWSLFMTRMSGGNLSLASEKYVIARRIIKKCGGVPLAIRALGDLLREHDIERWMEVEKSDVWEIEDKYGILPSLKLSFHYLPNTALKKCFSYCAIFGEDEVIEKDKLIQMWMAQGFLQPCDKMELIGEEYLYVLLNSSLFQEAELNELGNVETFKIHDLVLSLARVVSREVEFVSSKGKIKVNDTSSEFRHLSVTLFGEELPTTFCKKLRTYYYNPLHRMVYMRLNFLMHSKNLRVLCLCNLAQKKLPDSVGSLKHLRYLDISGNEFETLPKVITKLHQLQTLQIEFNGTFYEKKHFPVLSEEVGNLVNLRHICGGHQEIGIPLGLCHLTALQTIPIIDLREDWGGRLCELGSLNNLKGKLEIRGLEHINSVEEARSLNLGSKLNVDRLILIWTSFVVTASSPIRVQSPQMNEILEALQPRDKLVMLKVKNYAGTRLPQWLIGTTAIGCSLLNNLVSLKLMFLHAEGNLNMENLKSVRFLSVKHCYGLTISFPDQGFQCCKLLEVLNLQSTSIKNLPDVSPLIKLSTLSIIRCHWNMIRTKLVGLANLPCLKELRTDAILPRDLSEDSPVCQSLCKLELVNDYSRSLPVQVQHFAALQVLKIREFENLVTLPDWLVKLTSLRELELVSIPNLMHLPTGDGMRRLSNLQTFRVKHCPRLEEEFSEGRGEWFKVAHIIECKQYCQVWSLFL
ncbi:hypothetical protein SOVF_044000 [Spinacia oleracea]|nr:hypothetical protein SOVF_044000 [Spinacia oleracea]